jgi:hypothetical protein
VKPQQRSATIGEALKGRQQQAWLAPFQGLLDYLPHSQGFSLGFRLAAPLGLFRKSFYLKSIDTQPNFQKK